MYVLALEIAFFKRYLQGGQVFEGEYFDFDESFVDDPIAEGEGWSFYYFLKGFWFFEAAEYFIFEGFWENFFFLFLFGAWVGQRLLAFAVVLVLGSD